MNPINLKTQQFTAAPVTPLAQHIQPQKEEKKLPWIVLSLFALFIGGLFVVNQLYIAAPSGFKANTIIEVERGDSASGIAFKLKNAHVVKDAFALRVIMKLKGASKIEEGPYLFKSPVTVFSVANILTSSEHGVAQASILIPEGWTRMKMADRFVVRLPNFNKNLFMSLTEGREGYLFPDTYRFFMSASSVDVANAMEKNFEKQTADVKKEAGAKGRNWNDVVTIASILEGEGSPAKDERAMIADILLRRIEKHMRLQVDAPFLFLLGKGTRELSQEDLFVDSPYNTYRHEGLPPGPIGSPGVESMKSALNPIANEYLFYLHDKNGVIHYAKTNAEHVRNKMLYLK